NPCAQAVSLQGYSLVTRCGGCGSDTLLITFGANNIAADGCFLVGHTNYTGNKDATAANHLDDNKGGIALLKPNGGTPVDKVGYGNLTSNAYLDGMPAPLAASGQSAARSPNGKDTDDNSKDFIILATPSPRVKN